MEMSRDLRMDPEVAFSSLKPNKKPTTVPRDARFTVWQPDSWSCAEGCNDWCFACTKVGENIKKWWKGEPLDW